MWGCEDFFSYSAGCHFVLFNISFALQKLFSFRRSYLLIVALSVLILVLYLGSSLLCQCVTFKVTFHFLFYEVQCGWIYVEVSDPLGLEFYAWG